MPKSINDQVLELMPQLNQMVSSEGSNQHYGFGDVLSSTVKAQPGLGQPAVPISNLASGGPIGLAPATVDNAAAFLVNQSTAGQAISLPTPSDPSVVRTAHVVNVGSQAFTASGVTVAPGQAHQQLWHGSAWVPLV